MLRIYFLAIMTPHINKLLDANFNRIAEGLRVIEEYTRFIAQHKSLTDQLATLRKQLKTHPLNTPDLLAIRDTTTDQRANEPPPTRPDMASRLRANFSRVTEALRVLEEYTSQPVFTDARYTCYTLEKEIVLTLLKPQLTRGIYLISDDPKTLLDNIHPGVCAIQLRDKIGSRATILEKATTIKATLSDNAPPFIINDHLDIALACDADGLHTGQDDLPIATIRDLLGPHKLIGRSAHSIEQGLDAQEAGADYVSVGPIFKTPSKPGREAIGFEYLKAASQLEIPYVAIGGIDETTIDEIMAYAPPMVGVIRAIKNLSQLLHSYQP